MKRLLSFSLLIMMFIILIPNPVSAAVQLQLPAFDRSASTIGTNNLGTFTMVDGKYIRNFGFYINGAKTGDKFQVHYDCSSGTCTYTHLFNNTSTNAEDYFTSTTIRSFTVDLIIGNTNHTVSACLAYVTATDDSIYYKHLNHDSWDYGVANCVGSSGNNGGSDVKTVDGHYYYWPEKDIYKYDYTPPAGVAYYELHYLDDNGNTLYKRVYNDSPTGVHYLTCNGIYQMRFFDSSGNLIAQSPKMYTTEMIHPSCNSSAGDSGYNDFQTGKTKNPDGTVTITWPPVPGADHYEVYRDGQKVKDTTGTSYTGPDGNYSVIAKGSDGNTIGQSDVPAGTGSGSSGSQECASQICQCINDLKPAIEQLKPAIDALKPTLDQIANNTGGILDSIKTEVVPELNQIKSILDDFRSEFKTDKNYPVPSAADYPSVNLSDNKPPERSGVFVDNTTYFTDQGDDPEKPAAFPPAPEPVESWKDADGNVITQEVSKEKDPPMKQDEALKQDELLKQDKPLERDEPMEQDKTQYKLRWQMVDGVIVE